MTRDTIVDSLEPFTGHRRSVGVGYKFDGYDDGDIRISPGDVVVFEDPDAGQHAGGCELIHQHTIVAYVECVYAVDYSYDEGYSVEVGTSGPIGRLSVGDRYTAIVTEDGIIGGTDGRDTRDMASRLVDHDDAERYLSYEYHMGERGVPEDLWAAYDDSSRSGPGCPYCSGEKGQDGLNFEYE